MIKVTVIFRDTGHNGQNRPGNCLKMRGHGPVYQGKPEQVFFIGKRGKTAGQIPFRPEAGGSVAVCLPHSEFASKPHGFGVSMKNQSGKERFINHLVTFAISDR